MKLKLKFMSCYVFFRKSIILDEEKVLFQVLKILVVNLDIEMVYRIEEGGWFINQLLGLFKCLNI